MLNKHGKKDIDPKIVSLLQSSEYWNEPWYLAQNQNVLKKGRDALEHYLSEGWQKGLDPSPLFSTLGYLEAYPDIKQAGISPLLHYVTHGVNEGRLPRPTTLYPLADKTDFWVQSYSLLQKLSSSGLNELEFECPSIAFHCVQAKRTGLHFRETNFSFITSECSYMNEQNPLNKIKKKHMELYSLRHYKTLARKIGANHKPLVSICMPYFNAESWFADALQSLLSNDYPNMEVIIADDGSAVPLSLNSPDVTVLRVANGGPASARNIAAKHAKGEYMLFCDADNVFSRDMVSQMVASALFSGCDCMTPFFERFGDINKEDIWTPLGDCVEYGFFTNTFGDSNMIVRAEAFRELGGFDESLEYYEDWDFLARLVLAGYDYDVIPKSLLRYRVRADGVNAKADFRAGQERITKLYQERQDAHFEFLTRFCLDAFHDLSASPR